MKENEAFTFIGNMKSFTALLDEVHKLTLSEWLEYKKRKMAGGAAAENTDTIPLIYDLKHRLNSAITHENNKRFRPYIDEVILSVSAIIGEVEVQQAMLTKLNAGTTIPRHKDRGPLTAKTHRIHVPIITNDKCLFTVAEESRNLEAGQIWIIDNVDRHHSVENKGHTDRVHLIIDAI